MCLFCSLTEMAMKDVLTTLLVAVHDLPQAGRDTRVSSSRIKTIMNSFMHHFSKSERIAHDNAKSQNTVKTNLRTQTPHTEQCCKRPVCSCSALLINDWATLCGGGGCSHLFFVQYSVCVCSYSSTLVGGRGDVWGV